MAKKSTGHPARISGRQKFVHNLAIQNEAAKGKKKSDFKPLDTSKPNWSSRRPISQ